MLFQALLVDLIYLVLQVSWQKESSEYSTHGGRCPTAEQRGRGAADGLAGIQPREAAGWSRTQRTPSCVLKRYMKTKQN